LFDVHIEILNGFCFKKWAAKVGNDLLIFQLLKKKEIAKTGEI